MNLSVIHMVLGKKLNKGNPHVSLLTPLGIKVGFLLK